MTLLSVNHDIGVWWNKWWKKKLSALKIPDVCIWWLNWRCMWIMSPILMLNPLNMNLVMYGFKMFLQIRTFSIGMHYWCRFISSNFRCQAPWVRQFCVSFDVLLQFGILENTPRIYSWRVFFFGGGLAEVDSSAKRYEIIKSTPFEILDCHGGWEGGNHWFRFIILWPLTFAICFFLMYHHPQNNMFYYF